MAFGFGFLAVMVALIVGATVWQAPPERRLRDGLAAFGGVLAILVVMGFLSTIAEGFVSREVATVVVAVLVLAWAVWPSKPKGGNP